MLRFTAGRIPHSRTRSRSTHRASRRLATALAVPVLLLTAAACGSDDGGGGSGSGISVEGAFGETPKISVSKDAEVPSEMKVSTLTEGKGATVAKGEFVRFDYAVQAAKEGMTAQGSWAPTPGAPAKGPRRSMVQQVGGSGSVPPTVFNSLAGRKVGSRVWVEGTVKSLYGDQLPQGLNPDDGLVWVLDVVNAAKIDPKGEAKGEQAKPEAGMPEVKVEPGKAAEITIPKGEKPPKELKEQVLIKGDGPELKAGDGLVGQYTGVFWDGGKKFDSSWDHKPAPGATGFQIGTSSVIAGWDKGLVGKHVGDRVLMVIPPDLAYGDTPPPGSNIPKGATLVFVVDIVGKV
ncbi:FKBP-type peptidyl-prolyl cis-trans isomerase [Streptomyces sp. AV19]|uniref:FKBP-type peptidyl-prolyl cis-trans isomerase n=1 Tax=Streptomyces sp. AV19 TaxID=2793068 RepID=UPI0018FEC40F|nr:FKBP-type peptidyl-prolyl cis-trans isomerase [Streptomyces sp. AV19]MBH1936690.1 FKBP-type peptidyl-prolyl cis-trans isomerase [Streptomyces sp. AV19]MDG4532748.1 FKBP-type peptidyl-prolyl cis-trans isomerase [Streptomyces sp. AV19]